MIPKPPCLNCNDREPSCHSVCKKYISFRKAKDKINEEEYKKRLTNAKFYNNKRINNK